MGMLLVSSTLIVSNVMPAYAAGSSKTGSSQAREMAKNVLQSITTDSMTEVEKITAVHDYMVINTRYDEAAYYTRHSAIGSATFEADGPILYGTGVCLGYANAFKVYMDFLGIPCTVVSGANHAWNRVTLGGVSYDIDVTWDDPLPDRGAVQVSEVSHMFFLLSPDEMALRHSSNG